MGAAGLLPLENRLAREAVLVLARDEVLLESSSSAEGSRACSATQLAMHSGSGIQGKLCTRALANCSGVHTCAHGPERQSPLPM